LIWDFSVQISQYTHYSIRTPFSCAIARVKNPSRKKFLKLESNSHWNNQSKELRKYDKSDRRAEDEYEGIILKSKIEEDYQDENE
jgi:hypothetical protein